METQELRDLRFELIDITSNAVAQAYSALGDQLDDYQFEIDCAKLSESFRKGQLRLRLIELQKPDVMPECTAAALRCLILTTCSRFSVEPLEIFSAVIDIVPIDHHRPLYWFLFDICDSSEPMLEQCVKNLDWLVSEGKLNK